MTHIPPFKEACKHLGKVSDDDWLPFFTSKIMGDLLLEIASQNPTVKFLVLCGHTHNASFYQPLENLTVKASYAEYYHPKLQRVIEI